MLTIGFARRVPTYKRLTLMLHDPERLRALLTHPERPVQLVIAGKSHPADDEGKRLIQQLVQFAQQPEVRERIVFLPDYDIGMAELLYPGCDVWLNNPLRPLEACGTSGMKAALNGALNLSILDGWWAEYSDDDNGWVDPVGGRRGRRRRARRPRGRRAVRPARAPGRAAVLRARRRRRSRRMGAPTSGSTLATLSPELWADRMVREYVEELYRPAAEQARASRPTRDRGARELAAFDARVRAAWPPRAGRARGVRRGRSRRTSATSCTCARTSSSTGWPRMTSPSRSSTAGAAPTRRSRACAARRSRPIRPRVRRMPPRGAGRPRLFTGTVVLDRAGTFGYTVRVVPRHPHARVARRAGPGRGRTLTSGDRRRSRQRCAGDGRVGPAGHGDEVVGRELEVEPAPAARDVDRLAEDRGLVEHRRQRGLLADRADAAHDVARLCARRPPGRPSRRACRRARRERLEVELPATGTMPTTSAPSTLASSVLKTRSGSRPSFSAASSPYAAARGSWS